MKYVNQDFNSIISNKFNIFHFFFLHIHFQIGHALGLGHTEGLGSIMSRSYNNVEKLCEDDINAINRLYDA